MNNKTLTLNKKECNQVLEYIVKGKCTMYYMCYALYRAIYITTSKEWLETEYDTIIKNSFPTFTRKHFMAFLKENYQELIPDAKLSAEFGWSAWINHCDPIATKARKAFLKTLITE